MVAKAEHRGEETEPWYVSETLPFGNDVAPTIPFPDLGLGLPSDVALLLQRDAENQKQFLGGALAKDRSPVRPPPKLEEVEEKPPTPKEEKPKDEKPPKDPQAFGSNCLYWTHLGSWKLICFPTVHALNLMTVSQIHKYAMGDL